MDATKRLLGLLACAALVAIGGCPTSADPRLTNQGGGSLATATLKITQGEMSSLSPDEIQYVSDFLVEQAAGQGALPSGVNVLSDEDAALVIQLIQDNGIRTIADIERLINNPAGVVISPEVRAGLSGLIAPDLGAGV